ALRAPASAALGDQYADRECLTPHEGARRDAAACDAVDPEVRAVFSGGDVAMRDEIELEALLATARDCEGVAFVPSDPRNGGGDIRDFERLSGTALVDDHDVHRALDVPLKPDGTARLPGDRCREDHPGGARKRAGDELTAMPRASAWRSHGKVPSPAIPAYG